MEIMRECFESLHSKMRWIGRVSLVLAIASTFLLSFFLSAAHRHEIETAEGRMEKESETSGAKDALDFWTRSRAYPDNDIHPAKYYSAYQQQAALRTKMARTAALFPDPQWHSMGPGNIAGRMLCVAVNPSNLTELWAGSASGGLWHTMTRGVAPDGWHRIETGYPVLGVMAIAIDPANTDSIYIGTGEVYRHANGLTGQIIRTLRGSYGIGILVSANHGATWTKSLDWTADQLRGVEALRIAPWDSRTVFAATTEGIYRTTNGGSSWFPVLNVQMGEDIVINRNTNNVMVSCGNFGSPDRGIYVSTNKGEPGSWTKMGGGLPDFSGKTMLDLCLGAPNIVYASVADSDRGIGLYRSTNFGQAWIEMDGRNVPSFQGWYSHFVAVHPDDSKLLWAGVSYTAIPVNPQEHLPHADAHNFAHVPSFPSSLYIATDGGIYESDDFGLTYTEANLNLQTAQFYNGFSNSETNKDLAMGGMQDNWTAVYQGDPGSWRRVFEIADGGWTAINPVFNRLIYGESQWNQMEMSQNQGDSSNGVTRGLPYNFTKSEDIFHPHDGAFIAPFVMSKSNPWTIYAGRAHVYKTVDGALWWDPVNHGNPLDSNSILCMAVDPNTPDRVFAGTVPQVVRSHIFKTVDGGTTWTDVTGTLPDRYPMDIAIDPNDSLNVFVVYSGFADDGHVFQSTDGGATWANITGNLPDVPTSAIVLDPPASTHNLCSQNIYVGNDLGVWASTNDGTTWQPYSTGLPNAVIISDLSISPSDHKLWAATHGNGAYRGNLLPLSCWPLPRPIYIEAEICPFCPFNPYDRFTLPVDVINPADQAQTTPFDIKMRVLDASGIEVFSITKSVCCLDSGEIRTVNFDSTFTSPDTGSFTVQLLMDNGASAGYDLRTELQRNVRIANIATLVNVSKVYSRYVELVGGVPTPNGNGVQTHVGLPFPFTYDGIRYDSLQISTSGWAEFGKDSSGSMYGLSTPDQLGSMQGTDNSVLSTTTRPSKTLAAWWDNLAADDPSLSSSVTYATQGTAPRRVFIVQWKNMRAYADSYTTARINFQLRLYESTNVIEYDYGPIVGGTFLNSSAGASIGFKDRSGGNFRFYDVALMGTGYSTSLITNLTPWTGWPGPDSAYQIQTGVKAMTIASVPGWNLVSAPLVPADSSVTALFPSGTTRYAWSYSRGYQKSDTIVPGKGYWVKFRDAVSRAFVGSPMPSVSINLAAGWNIVGSVDHEVPPPVVPNEEATHQLTAFGYSSHGYFIATALEPGKAYWTKSDADRTVTIGDFVPPAKRTAVNLEECSTLTITDNAGRSQTLYFTQSEDLKLMLQNFEMPPVPPLGVFDARFESQRMLEVYESGKSAEFPIMISSPQYPLTISWDVRSTAFDAALKVGAAEIPMKQKGTWRTASPSMVLMLQPSRTLATPRDFGLEQNYPNPFNPTTTFKFELPVECRVSLKIYSILGQVVQTLTDGAEVAGYKSVEWNATNFASGIYFYRLEAINMSDPSRTFTQAKKMILLK